MMQATFGLADESPERPPGHVALGFYLLVLDWLPNKLIPKNYCLEAQVLRRIHPLTIIVVVAACSMIRNFRPESFTAAKVS